MRYYDAAIVKGRFAGIGLGAHYIANYGYDQLGRLKSVGWKANGTSDAAVYSRIERSELLAGYEMQSRIAMWVHVRTKA